MDSGGLKMPKKQRTHRRLGNSDNGYVRRCAEHNDHVWARDVVHDRTTSGRPSKWLTIIDEYARECLALEVSHRMKAEDLLDVPAELFALRGVPKHIRSDNSPEFIAHAIRRWLQAAGIEPLYIEPGSPGEIARLQAGIQLGAEGVFTRAELFHDER